MGGIRKFPANITLSASEMGHLLGNRPAAITTPEILAEMGNRARLRGLEQPNEEDYWEVVTSIYGDGPLEEDSTGTCW